MQRMFTATTQREEKDYQEGRRDGFAGTLIQRSHSPAYRAGYRMGLLESCDT